MRGIFGGDVVACFWEDFRERERGHLSRNTQDPTVGGLLGEKEKRSTRSRLRVDPGFVEFPQTPRGRIFPLLEFYSYFKGFVDVSVGLRP